MTTTAHPQHDTRKISEVLADILRNAPGDRIRLRDLVSALEDRAFGLLIFILALPNAIGIGAIPGVSTVFGVPQIILGLQMMIGLERPWLPQWLLDKGIARKDFTTMIEKSTPYLHKVERFLRPRWEFMSSYVAERILGAIMAVMAAIVSMPIPFGNQPPAVAMALISLGVIERDGMFVILGLVAAVISVALAGLVVVGGGAAIWLLFSTMFGGA
jgi:hypothetical protein